jgi:GxxExxY protein
MTKLIYKEECFRIVGACMEVHRELGKGHNENIYQDALELEFKAKGISFVREQPYTVSYKGTVLPHSYFADFIVLDTILLEAKAIEQLTDSHSKQVLNYLAASKLQLGLLVNFGQDSLVWKRVVLSRQSVEDVDLKNFSRKFA